MPDDPDVARNPDHEAGHEGSDAERVDALPRDPTRDERLHVRRGIASVFDVMVQRGGNAAEVGRAVMDMQEVLEALPEHMRYRDDVLVDEIRGGIHLGHRKWLAGRKDIPDELRATLATPDGRLTRRICTFNKLCDKGIFGLTRKAKYSRFVDNARMAFERHLSKVLDADERALFERVCGSFDGENMLHALESSGASLAHIEASKGHVDAEKLAGERAALFQDMQKRLRNEGFAETMQIGQAGAMARFLDAGGDVALGLASLYFMSPWLYAAKIGKAGVEAITGIETADLLGWLKDHAVSKGKRASMWTLKKLWDVLPERFRDKTPARVGRWIEKERPPDVIPKRFLPNRFASVGIAPRIKHFVTGAVPFLPSGVLPFGKIAGKALEKKGLKDTGVMLGSETISASAIAVRQEEKRIRDIYLADLPTAAAA